MKNKPKQVKFTKKAVKEYLDECIDFWRAEEEAPSKSSNNFEEEAPSKSSNNFADTLVWRREAKHYIDAFQSVRISLNFQLPYILFGKLKD